MPHGIPSPLERVRVRLLFFILLNSFSLHAQITYRGTVTDSETTEPLEMATVRLVQGSNEKLISYTFTDAKGAFAIKCDKKVDSLFISVTMVGYKTYITPAVSGQLLKIPLATSSISLREVIIKPGRISSRNDTITYNIADMVTSKDESVKDIIKKLPGLDVDQSGRISYNGKNISKFYVEGMDLSGGKYNQISNNLQAKAIDVVQVLENHQPVRMLQDKIYADDVALNLKLKPEFKDKWMFNLFGGTGYPSDHLSGNILWEADANALQLSRKSQSSYIYKTNNMGYDISDENKTLVDVSSTKTTDINMPSFIAQPSFNAPLRTERWLFNNVHSASANRLYKMGETTQLRVNAGYVHDYRKQERGSNTVYYQQGDTININEQTHTGIRSDLAEVSLNFENNAEKYFMTNNFSSTSLWEKGTTHFFDDRLFTQQIKTSNAGFKNEFRNIWNKNNYTLEVNSLIRFSHAPATLRAEGIIDNQNITVNRFYTDNNLSIMKKKGYYTYRYSAGMKGQVNNIQNVYTGYLSPMWQINKSKIRGTLNLPLAWNKFPGENFSRFTVNPSISLRYKLNYAWQFFIYGGYSENYGDITDFYTNQYYTDYRHIVLKPQEVTMNRSQIYSAYGEYKNILTEFFTTLSISYNRYWSDHIYEQIVDNDYITLSSRSQSTTSTGWTAQGTISKGIYDWNLKLSLNYRLGYNKAEQLSKGERLPYKSTYMFYEPKISWSPLARLEIDYQSSFRYGGTKIGDNTKLTPLWNVVQKLNLFYDFNIVEFGVSTDHYYNDVTSNKGINVFLLDTSLRWNHERWQIKLTASNLLDKNQYGYTQYSSLQSYTSWVNIRGREFKIAVRYRL